VTCAAKFIRNSSRVATIVSVVLQKEQNAKEEIKLYAFVSNESMSKQRENETIAERCLL
jgi:hypothetical protein